MAVRKDSGQPLQPINRDAVWCTATSMASAEACHPLSQYFTSSVLLPVAACVARSVTPAGGFMRARFGLVVQVG